MNWSSLSDDIFVELLPHLDLSQLKCLHLVNQNFSGLVKKHCTHINPSHFSFYIPDAFPNLLDLDLSRCWNEINDVKLIGLAKRFSRAGKVKLVKLNLSKCHAVTNRGIAAVSEHLNTLEELNLSGCRSSMPASYVGYTGVNGQTIRDLPNLKKLYLSWNPVTDSSFKSISKFKDNLIHLDLGECHGMSDSGIQEISEFVNLEVLNLGRTMISKEGIRALVKLRFLRDLSLRNCSEISDECLELISEMSSLVKLDLGKLNNITDSGVEWLRQLPNLAELDLTYCTRLNGSWINFSSEWNKESNWKLTKLNLTDCCNWVTDSIMEVMSSQTKRLQTLILENCVKTTKVGLISLLELKLRCLDLSLCYSTEDEELNVVAKMTSLEDLNLAFCTRITDSGLAALQNLINMKSLNLNCCRKVTSFGLRSLQCLSKSLRRLEISACHGIETDIVFFLSNWFRNLEFLNLSWLSVNDTQFRSLKNLRNLQRVEVKGCHELSGETLSEFWYLEGIGTTQNLG